MLVPLVFRHTMSQGGWTGDQRAAVEAHLRRLDSPALAAFVADLWSGRGFDTQRDGTVITAIRGNETQTVSVGGLHSLPTGESVDIVVDVSSASMDDITVLDETDLAEQLWYAVERPVARRLCEQHFGAPPGNLSPPFGVRVRRSLGRPHGVVTVGLVVALLAVVGLGVAVGFGEPPASTNGTQTGDDTAESPATPSPVRTSVAGQPVINQPLPPGITPNGLADIEALGRAHADAVEGRSYTLSRTVVWTDIRDQEVVTVERDIDMTVEGAQYRIDTDDMVAGNRTQVGVLYHDGQNSYVAPNDRADTGYRQVGELEQTELFSPPPSTVTASLVETRLSTPTSNLTGTVERDGETLYRLTGRGEPEWPAVGGGDEYNVTALATLSGFVQRVDSTFTVRSGNRLIDVRQSVRYSAVGETNVTPPAWYDTTTDRNDSGG